MNKATDDKEQGAPLQDIHFVQEMRFKIPPKWVLIVEKEVRLLRWSE
jgi:hypothetical protein